MAGSADNVSAEQLRLFIEWIETLEEEKRGISDDIKDVYAEAKGTGFDTKTIRAIVRLRRMEKSARQEADALLETYKAAIVLMARVDHVNEHVTLSGWLWNCPVGFGQYNEVGPGLSVSVGGPAAMRDRPLAVSIFIGAPGFTAFLSPDQARVMAGKLTELADLADATAAEEAGR